MVQEKHKCQVCGATFETEADLKIHHRTIHERFRCESCGKTFHSESELKTHLWVSHPEDIPVR